jgi:hypothetical protein
LSSLSISFTLGKASEKHGANIDHNNRIFFAKNVDKAKIKDNITYAEENVRDVYHKLFDEALQEYNAKQYPYRRINDYFEHVSDSNREEAFYEIVVQFGDKNSAPVGSENGEISKNLLEEYMKDFQKRNPNLYVFNAVLHMDETSPHLHIDVVPFYTNPRERFLKKGVSMREALDEQGFIAKNFKENRLVAWEAVEREEMRKILLKNGLCQDVKNIKTPHLPPEEFKRVQDARKLIIKGKKTITPEELARENIENLHSKIAVLSREVSKLSNQKNSPLKNFYYSSEEKNAFVKSELERLQIPFYETDNGFSASEFLTEDIRAIEKKFKASENPVRQIIRNEIDKFIMQSNAFEDFLTKLKQNDYQIKLGKYLALKTRFGQQFIRTKSLGEEYSEQALRNRITNKINFEKANENKISMLQNLLQNAENFELCICRTVRQYTTVFAKNVLPMNKKNSQKSFAWTNDRELERILNLNKIFNDKNVSIDKINEDFEKLEKIIYDNEMKISQLKKELVFYDDLLQKSHIAFETVPQTPAQKNIFFSAQQFLSQNKITRENYKIISTTAEKNCFEIAKFEQDIYTKREKLKEISELKTTFEEITGGTYVQKLIQKEIEKQRAEFLKFQKN